MDFNNYKCPVCNKQLTKDDDIVVCPECGAPHHRECYEKENHCFYEDKHSEDFSFEDINSESENSENTDEKIIICKNCKAENPKETFYCYKCGAPLNEQDKKNYGSGQQNANPFGGGGTPPFGVPFGQGQQVINPFDPMAGFKNDEVIAENVTAGEMAKFVGKNTQYFLRIFNTINKFKTSRFNFSAFIFSGMYFLYRKMLVIGSILSFLIIALTVAEIYVQMLPIYQNAATTLLNAMNSGQYITMFNIPGVSTQDMIIALIPGLIELLKLIIMVVSGAIANRSYYKHSIKKINSIKQTDGQDVNKALESKGGVNLPLAIGIGAAYMIISYIPIFF